MPDLSETDGALSIDDFCARYGVCKTNVYALIARGELKARKFQRRTLIPVAAAREWLNGLPAYTASGVRFRQATA